MREATTTRRVDYFNLPRPLWRKLKKCLPKNKRKMSTKGGRPRASDRAVINAIWYVLWTGCQWKAIHRDWFGVSSSVVHERFQRWRQMGVFEKLMKRMAEYYVLRKGAWWNRLEVAGYGLQTLWGSFGRGENGQKPHRQRQVRSEDKPPGRRTWRPYLGHTHRSQPPRQGLGYGTDLLGDSKASGAQGAEHLCADKAYDSDDLREFSELPQATSRTSRPILEGKASLKAATLSIRPIV